MQVSQGFCGPCCCWWAFWVRGRLPRIARCNLPLLTACLAMSRSWQHASVKCSLQETWACKGLAGPSTLHTPFTAEPSSSSAHGNKELAGDCRCSNHPCKGGGSKLHLAGGCYHPTSSYGPTPSSPCKAGLCRCSSHHCPPQGRSAWQEGAGEF